MSDGAVLRLEGLTKRFGGRAALADVGFTVNKDEYVSLLGPSGSGKTTLLRAIAGFEAPEAGRIWLENRDLTRVPAYRRDIGFVFQNFALFPHLSVLDNVAFGLRNRATPAPEGEARARAIETLELVGLQGLEQRGVNQISGGQKQRVALARTLVTRPKLVLLDEPLGALDANLRHRIRSELRRIRDRLDIPFLHVTGSETEALSIGDRLIVLDAGRVGQQGSPDEVYNRPATPNIAKFLNRYNVFSGKLEGSWFVGAHGRFGYGARVPGGEGAYAIRHDRIAAAPPGASDGPRVAASYVASEYMGSALVHFFEARDGKVIEVEHHLSHGPPDSFDANQAYELTWKADDGIAFG